MPLPIITTLMELSEPSRDVDIRIYRNHFLAAVANASLDPKTVPAFTSSLDAAMSLLPDGCQVYLTSDGKRHFAYVDLEPGDTSQGTVWEEGATLAIAAGIAILKTRAGQVRQQPEGSRNTS